MSLGQADFLLGRHARAISALRRHISQCIARTFIHQEGQPKMYGKKNTHGKSTGTPRSPTPHRGQIGQGRKRRGVTQRHIDHAVVGEGAHRRQRRALLSTALGSGADENANVLAVVAARLPLFARLVPEGFPLIWEITESRRDTEEEGVILFEFVGGDEWDGAGLAGSMHLGEDLLGEGLFDSTRGEQVRIDLLKSERRLNAVRLKCLDL